MKTILVPCDFSKPAVNAFRVALDIAKKSRGIVHLLNVIELPAIQDPVIMPVAAFEMDFMKDLKDRSNMLFDRMITKYDTKGVQVKKEIRFGSPSSVIMETIRKRKVTTVVMGTHGATGIKELFIGSNAEKIVRSSPVPVLIVREYKKTAIQNIVFPNTLDLQGQDKLIEKIKELQAFFRATLHIVYVNTPTNFTADNITMLKLREFARHHGLKKYTLNVYNYPFEVSGILQFARGIKADLIAMGTHGRKGLAHFLNGSIAEDIANHADRPIWTYAS